MPVRQRSELERSNAWEEIENWRHEPRKYGQPLNHLSAGYGRAVREARIDAWRRFVAVADPGQQAHQSRPVERPVVDDIEPIAAVAAERAEVGEGQCGRRVLGRAVKIAPHLARQLEIATTVQRYVRERRVAPPVLRRGIGLGRSLARCRPRAAGPAVRPFDRWPDRESGCPQRGRGARRPELAAPEGWP